MAQSAGVVEYIDCFSAEVYDLPFPTNVLFMTLNNLMVRFQQGWGFGEGRVPLPGSMNQRELNCIFMLN